MQGLGEKEGYKPVAGTVCIADTDENGSFSFPEILKAYFSGSLE